MANRIFVQIAAYRDPECEWTIRDLFAKAAHPENISIGICWQFVPGEDDGLLPLAERRNQIHLLEVEAKDSKGACWARHEVQKFYNGEDFLLQIDSHMRFEPRWDEKLIAQCALTSSQKPVLTGYPPSYMPPNDLGKNERHIMFAKQFGEDGILTFQGTPAGENNSVPAPVYGMFCSAGFLFGPGSIVREVPYDPYLYFYGEEISLSARLWTHGFDIYHPSENVIYHYYKKAGDSANKTHWGDNKEWHKINTRALNRVKHLLNIEQTEDGETLREIEKYGLGSVRSLADYEAVSGVDFRQKTFSENAKKGIFDVSHKNAVIAKKKEDSMDASWSEWTKHNLGRNCNPEEILGILLKQKFSIGAIRKAMGDKFPADSPQLETGPAGEKPATVTGADHKALCEIPLLRLGRFPNIERYDDSRVQLLSLDNFLTDEECAALIKIIEPSLRPSTVTYANDGFRTSRTSDLSLLNDPIVTQIDRKISEALGISLHYSEGNQAQKYNVGEEFKAHTDFFEPGSSEYEKYTGPRGNRTWTFMIYLNDTPKGGGTRFVKLDTIFYPKKGRAVLWNNLLADGSPSRDTQHWGMPVEEGEKIIVTKWFREKGLGKMFLEAKGAKTKA